MSTEEKRTSLGYHLKLIAIGTISTIFLGGMYYYYRSKETTHEPQTEKKMKFVKHDSIEETSVSAASVVPNVSNGLNPRAYELFTKNWRNTGDEEQHVHKQIPIHPTLICGTTLMTCIHHKPNVFEIKNFLSDSEINHLLSVTRNNIQHFEMSYTQRSQSSDSLSQQVFFYTQQRTSTNLFLPKSADKTINFIENKAANLVGVSNKNVEQLQIVRYTNGQRFDLHHDGGTLRQKPNNKGYSIDVMLPSRMFSMFVYLTSLPPDSGGETYFPKIGLKMRPQRGTALLWCNVDTDNVLKADPMLIHKGCPVIGNHEKVGLNIWIKTL